jgi:MerR family Zn(II)-responsive transcriptional regulator of zntA
VAKATGLSPDAIRFYEKQMLLHRTIRTDGGFRLFSDRDIEHLKFIQQAQALGFSLAEIRELLDLQGEVKACAQVREQLRNKISQVRSKIRHLKEIEKRLVAGLRKCSRTLASAVEPETEPCPVFSEHKPRRRTRGGENHENRDPVLPRLSEP